MTFIEIIARAYAAAWKADIEKHLLLPAPSWEDMGPGHRAAMLRCARAVIEAISEPTAEMCISGGIAISETATSGADQTLVDISDACWRAMIAKAISASVPGPDASSPA